MLETLQIIHIKVQLVYFNTLLNNSSRLLTAMCILNSHSLYHLLIKLATNKNHKNLIMTLHRLSLRLIKPNLIFVFELACYCSK